MARELSVEIDLDLLLAPVSDAAPAGEDLSYDSDRYRIEQVFETSVSVDATGEAAQGAEVDWEEIIRLIVDQSARSKDIWLAVYLCRAAVNGGWLSAAAVGAEFLAGLFERFWDTVHPQLDEAGFQGRKGPCESLAGLGQFIRPLRRVALLQHPRFGVYSGEDLDRFRQEREQADGYGLFRAALEQINPAELQAVVERLERMDQAFRRVDTVLTNHALAEGTTGANFKVVYDTLADIKRAVQAFSGAPPEPVEATQDRAVGAADAGSEDGGDGPGIGGRVNSRQDVFKALDAIADYYRRKEPASPVPLALERARGWVTLDFLSVLEDIAPGSLDEARSILVPRGARSGGGATSATPAADNSGW